MRCRNDEGLSENAVDIEGVAPTIDGLSPVRHRAGRTQTETRDADSLVLLFLYPEFQITTFAHIKDRKMQTNISLEEYCQDTRRPLSFRDAFCREWRWWLPGAILSFIGASVFMTGWPRGLVPNLKYPYTYDGDGLFISWMIQRVHEGWIFNNVRSGYPFFSSFLDYPSSDAGNFLALKVIGLFTNGFSPTLNLYFLLGFSLAFITAYCGFRALRLSASLSFVAAALFDFAPFHFLRLAHIFYTWYFVIPIFFHIAIKIFYGHSQDKQKYGLFNRCLLSFLTCMILASFGVYYALFGLITIGTATVAGCLSRKNTRTMLYALTVIGGIAIGVLANITPNIIHGMVYGNNPEAVVRQPGEAEIYGFKPIQLFLPRWDHRVKELAEVQKNYDRTSPLVNENTTASLGLIGALGFLALGITIFLKLSDIDVDDRLAILGILILILLLFGTIGGLGSIFSRIISSEVRGWNRISIFIAYGSVAAFFIAIQNIASKMAQRVSYRNKCWALAVLVLGVGMYDQTTPACTSCNLETKSHFYRDSRFINKIEQSVPPGSAIYQLPYMPFPETAPRNKLETYDLTIGFLESKTLKWSYGGMKGRPGDLFYRALSKEPIEKQLQVVQKLGFSGIYIDRRGYKDNGNSVINQLSNLLNEQPLLERSDGRIVFFKLPAVQPVDLTGLGAAQVMQRVGYVVGRLGVKYSATLSQGVDFTKDGAPYFIKSIYGVSAREPWGRWSDANISQSVKIDFISPLPQRFTLRLVAQPFGVNGQQDVSIALGSRRLKIHLVPGINNIDVPVDLNGAKITSIDIKPLNPVSPEELGVSNSDSRRLGIGLIRLQILQQAQ